MVRFLIRRLVSGAIAFLVFTAIVFFAFNLLVPFDYVTTLSMFIEGDEARQALREELGLTLPLWQQYLDWLALLARGELGQGFTISGRGYEVTERIKGALPATLLVFISGSVVAFWVGHWLGKVSGWRAPRVISGAFTVTSIAAYTAFPPWLVFVLGYLLIDRLGLIHALGFAHFSDRLWSDAPFSPSEVMLDMVYFSWGIFLALVLFRWLFRRLTRRQVPTYLLALLFLLATAVAWLTSPNAIYMTDILTVALIPFLAILLLAFGDTMLIMQSGMLDTRHEPYIQTARAKGLSERLVRDRHAARNALLPALSRFVINLPYLLTAIFIVERATAWPGIGNTMFTAIYNQNTFVYMGVLVLVGLVTLFARFFLDLAQALLDPRIRYDNGTTLR